MIDLFDHYRSRSHNHLFGNQIDFSPGDHHEIPVVVFAALLISSAVLVFNYPHLHQSKWHILFFMLSAASNAYLWQHFWRLYHYIADTPTSRVATASQGLVELHGIGDLLPGESHRGLAMGPPCIWQAYTISNGDGIERAHSKKPFILQDTSGSCVIYPEGAIVIASSTAYPRQGDSSANIRYLRPGCSLYVLGQMRTIGGDNNHYDVDKESGKILRRWKQNQKQLVTDYDTDHNGRIDVPEWEAARADARSQAQRQIDLKRQSAVTHEIRKPDNGMPLVISDREPKSLQRRYYWLGNASACLAIASFIWGAINI